MALRTELTRTAAPRRAVVCECGAHLAGESEMDLFDAVERHLAHHHPQLLGALDAATLVQMAEDAWE